MSGIPEPVRDKPWGHTGWWARRRCRRRGGHFGPVERLVDYRTISASEWCCSECRTIVEGPSNPPERMPPDLAGFCE